MITVVGTGPGNIKYLTEEARDMISDSKNIIAFGRISESMKSLNSGIKKVSNVEQVKNIVIEILSSSTDKSLTILASGDPCFYGITDYLTRNGIEIDRVITGISSFQYMMSRLKRSSNDIKPISFHGRESDFSLFKKGKSYFILTDKIHSPDYISKELYENGFTGKITLGENLSYDNEVIKEKRIGELFGEREISVVVVDLDVD